jgi:FdhE protein
MAAGGRTRIVGGRIGDPTRETVGQPIPVILPEPDILFARRAERLEALAAADHPMADWLRFTARLSRAQHEAIAALPMAEPVRSDRGRATARLWQPSSRSVLADRSPSCCGPRTIPRCRTRCARRSVGCVARDTATVDALADAYLRGDTQKAERGEAVFIAAAIAAYFAHRAAVLPAADVHLLAQRGCCPVCGFAPVAGVVTAAGMHQACATCTVAVRDGVEPCACVCIACGSSRGLALHGIEGDEGAVQAETCDECRSYVKMLTRRRTWRWSRWPTTWPHWGWTCWWGKRATGGMRRTPGDRRSMIIGTAGHVDHGKTALVKALTGIDADRLAEEKRRHHHRSRLRLYRRVRLRRCARA